MANKHSSGDKHKSKHKKEKLEKHKKHKKYKKSKKDKKDKEKFSDSKETKKKEVQEPLKREEWNFFDTILSSSNVIVKDVKEKSTRSAPEELGQNVRELNPYWKDGGCGLPPNRPKENFKDEVSDLTYSAQASSSKSFNLPISMGKSSLGFLKPGEDSKINANANTFQRNWKKKEVKEHERESERRADAKECEPKENVATSSRVLTNEELNKLAAKLMKAEIMGNTDLVNKLKAELEAARKIKGNINEQFERQKEQIVVVDKGMKKSYEGEQNYTGSKRQKVKTHDGQGRICYFPDDDKYSLQNLFPNPITLKEGTALGMYETDQLKDLTGLVTCYPVNVLELGLGSQPTVVLQPKCVHEYLNNNFPVPHMSESCLVFEKEKTGQEEEISIPTSKLSGKNLENLDDIYLELAASNKMQKKTEERLHQKTIKDATTKHKALEGCKFCIDNRSKTKHLIMSTGKNCYLCLPEEESLVPNHCLIVPLQHEISTLHLDEDVWSEMRTYQKVLTKMFLNHNQDLIFFENARSFKYYPHCFIQCVPCEKEMGDLAPIYFQKAIAESETEWSLNKKIVDFRNKDLRRSIPKGLPYFAVSFGTEGGFAHVIENEHLFKRNFAEEVIGGMMDLNHKKWRKPQTENFRSQREKALEFLKMWKKYEFNESSLCTDSSSSE